MARLFKVINLDEPPTGRRVTLRELTPAIVRNAVEWIKVEGDQLVFGLLYGDLSETAVLLDDCVELSPEVGGLEGLNYSEVFMLWDEFEKLNHGFFGLAAATGGVLAHLLTLSASRPSTAPAASSSPTDMQA